MTKQSSKTLPSLALIACFVALCLAGIFYVVDVSSLARAAIQSQLDDEVYCVSLGGMMAGACDDAG